MEETLLKEWDENLRKKISYLMMNGYQDIEELIPYCDGAQPKDIYKIYEELKKDQINLILEKIDNSDRNKFFFNLPAENPKNFQWWYTLKTQEDFSRRIIEESDPQKIACLGSPTIASTLKAYNKEILLLDNDQDIVNHFNNIHKGINAIYYDVYSELNTDLFYQYDVVAIDPPWYKSYFILFLNRAINLVKTDGVIYCSFPQLLTRPGIEQERQEIINSMLQLGHELMYIEKGSLQYIVPRFEEAVFNASNFKISNHPWRSADLIAFKIKNSSCMELDSVEIFPNETPIAFYKEHSANIFRIFFNKKEIKTGVNIRSIQNFSSTISQRDPVEEVNLWTSEKNGFQVENIILMEKILMLWSTNKNQQETSKIIFHEMEGYDLKSLENIIDEVEKALLLWSHHSFESLRRTNKEIKEINEQTYNSKFATFPTKRQHDTKDDGFRIEFLRDRDRIIWSAGFRNLSDKTQLFPVDEDDYLRQRLSHSIEVMQLASTIAASFGLNKDLVEAGALSHDIGHTPFGHAGEAALNNLFKKIGFTDGFNHYEHGVDVVRYLEGTYQHHQINAHPGLDLTPEVCECILKHSYSIALDKQNYQKSKHTDFIPNKTSNLECQCVRIADKISYLLSDLEDGIKLGVITLNDLMSCRLFNRPPIDLRLKNEHDFYTKFTEQRGSIIKLLMEDIIIESSKKLSKIESKAQIGLQSNYCILQSDQLSFDTKEIWDKLQKGKLHSDPRIISANMVASKYVSELTLLFTIFPEYIESNFKVHHQKLKSNDYLKFYTQKMQSFRINEKMVRFLPLDLMIGFDSKSLDEIDTYNLILAKDYIASLSNKKITKIYKKLLNS